MAAWRIWNFSNISCFFSSNVSDQTSTFLSFVWSIQRFGPLSSSRRCSYSKPVIDAFVKPLLINSESKLSPCPMWTARLITSLKRAGSFSQLPAWTSQRWALVRNCSAWKKHNLICVVKVIWVFRRSAGFTLRAVSQVHDTGAAFKQFMNLRSSSTSSCHVESPEPFIPIKMSSS